MKIIIEHFQFLWITASIMTVKGLVFIIRLMMVVFLTVWYILVVIKLKVVIIFLMSPFLIITLIWFYN